MKTVLAGLMTISLLPAQTAPADQPAARTDRNSQIALEQLLKKARQGRIDVYFVGEPDYAFNPAGDRGMGEIGITGAAAAVANAVYHATGKRVRDLPITIDKLI